MTKQSRKKTSGQTEQKTACMPDDGKHSEHSKQRHSWRIGYWLQWPILMLFQGIIKLYQWFISPILGPRCRFYPTCSHYSAEALSRHGLFWGSWLAIKRILKCHPGNEGGIDLVPECPTCAPPTPEEWAAKQKDKPIKNTPCPHD